MFSLSFFNLYICSQWFQKKMNHTDYCDITNSPISFLQVHLKFKFQKSLIITLLLTLFSGIFQKIYLQITHPDCTIHRLASNLKQATKILDFMVFLIAHIISLQPVFVITIIYLPSIILLLLSQHPRISSTYFPTDTSFVRFFIRYSLPRRPISFSSSVSACSMNHRTCLATCS